MSYDPETLKNLPRYVHELPAPPTGEQKRGKVDISKLLDKFKKEKP